VFHLVNSAREAGAAAKEPTIPRLTRMLIKYSQLSSTHILFPVAIKTAGISHHQAVELVKEIGHQHASSNCSWHTEGERGLFPTQAVIFHFLSNVLEPVALCLWA